MAKFNESFDYIKINLASPERIKQWACHTSRLAGGSGEVTKSETINYRTFKPEMGGLFCEKIFGPVKSWECHCGKYKRIRQQILVCERCGVEVTESRVRRHRMGYIKLEYPVAHIWYVRSFPSYISSLLGIKRRELKEILYFNEINFRNFDNTLLNWAKNLYGTKKPKAGAELIYDLLEHLDLESVVNDCRIRYATASTSDKEKIIKRIRILENFIATKSDPTWMLLSIIPVLPPGLRPMVQLEGGRFATSDLNELYRRVITRNNRLLRLLEIDAPQLIIRNEKRMLQEAVDTLIDNGKRGKIAVNGNNRPLKSLSDIIKGKHGRFRQNLLGKRVDYSGRSVIVVGPELKINQCGLPFEMAIELFQPFIIRELINQGLASNMKVAKNLIQQSETLIDSVLKPVLSNHPLFLNRAPTLHRLGIQAFEPVLVPGRAIKLHPLVCSAFNADFDGDQMAVHLPLSLEAQAECYTLMLAPYNFLSPANGEPIIMPSQDMVLGCYYLTVNNLQKLAGSNHYFADLEDVLLAYRQEQIDLHSLIWIRYNKQVSDFTSCLKKIELKDRTCIEYYEHLQIRKDSTGKILVQYLQTTAGRVIFNYIIQKTLNILDD